MLAEAKRECDRIIQEAREQAIREASQTEIVKLAERQARRHRRRGAPAGAGDAARDGGLGRQHPLDARGEPRQVPRRGQARPRAAARALAGDRRRGHRPRADREPEEYDASAPLDAESSSQRGSSRGSQAAARGRIARAGRAGYAAPARPRARADSRADSTNASAAALRWRSPCHTSPMTRGGIRPRMSIRSVRGSSSSTVSSGATAHPDARADKALDGAVVVRAKDDVRRAAGRGLSCDSTCVHRAAAVEPDQRVESDLLQRR